MDKQNSESEMDNASKSEALLEDGYTPSNDALAQPTPILKDDSDKNAAPDIAVKDTSTFDLKDLEIDESELSFMLRAQSLPTESDPVSSTETKVDAENTSLVSEAQTEAPSTETPALPRAESLDSILYSAQDDDFNVETKEESVSYERSLADYRKAMQAAFSAISKASAEENDNQALLNAENTARDNNPLSEEQESGIFSSETETDFSDSRELPEQPSTDPSAEDESTPDIGFSEQETEQMGIDFGEIPLEEGYDDEENPSLPIAAKPQRSKLDEKYDPKNPRKIDGVFEMVELFVFTLVTVLILATFFFRHSVVDGRSMDDTLADGEHLIITDFMYTPKRGDIIVFEDREANITTPYIKRVIGIPGDTVKVQADGSVYVNGELLVEDYVTHRPVKDKEVTCTVGEGELFVMGDQRRVSEDSRSFGVINDDGVLGKVILRIYPFSKFGTVE